MQEKVVEAAHVQLVLDRAEPCRLLGVIVAHAMKPAAGMRDEGDGHQRLRVRSTAMICQSIATGMCVESLAGNGSRVQGTLLA